MDRRPTERILADLQAAAMASPEPGQRIAPTGVVVTDANGLSLGAAPNGGLGHEGHAGAYRHIAKCADVLVMLVEHEEEQQALEHSHAINNDVRRNPVVFVQTEQRNIVVRKTKNDDVAVVVVPKNAQNEDDDEEHEDDERR